MLRPHFIILLLLLLFASMVATAYAGEDTVESITTEKSFKLDTTQFEGSVVFVDFWASWCKPCRKSFEWMSDMHEAYADAGLVIIAVGLDNDLDEAHKFLDKTTTPFRIVMDPKAKMAAAYDLGGMPCSFLFDREGNLVSSHVGFRGKDRTEQEARIRMALGLETAALPSTRRASK